MEVLKMAAFSYRYPETVRDILQGAKPVESRRHGNSRDGYMTLFQGNAGKFIVHVRQDRKAPVPEVRVMNLPGDISDGDAEQYARMHPDAFSPWQYMIQEIWRFSWCGTEHEYPHRKNRVFRLPAETLCFHFWDHPKPLLRLVFQHFVKC